MTTQTPTTLPRLLDALKKVDTQLHVLDDERKDTIRAARAEGATWLEIAEALGISKQAAWERFRSLGPTTRQKRIVL